MVVRKIAAELLGSFLFFTIGYLSVAAFGAAGASGLLVVPFSFGFGLLAAIFAFGHISGGHFNPAVTVAMVLDRRTTPVEAVGYIVAQVAGAIAAGLFVMVAVSQAAVAAGITKPNAAAGITDAGALLIETVMTAVSLFKPAMSSSTSTMPAPSNIFFIRRPPLIMPSLRLCAFA